MSDQTILCVDDVVLRVCWRWRATVSMHNGKIWTHSHI